MVRILIALGTLASIVLSPLAAVAAAKPFELKSVTLDLPESDRVFPGPGADAANNNCLACHSAAMVLNQPPLTKATWEAEVKKMINAYKAPVAQEDVAAIVEYLSTLQRPK